MKSKLITRLEKLEAIAPKQPTLIQCGWVTALPDDYVGERHLVILNREPTGSKHIEWCEFVERPGPAPRTSPHADSQVRLRRPHS